MNPFTFHTGLSLDTYHTQLKGDCPFCNKEQHFFCNPTNYLWDCKYCKKEGNLYTFLSLFHDLCCTYEPVKLLAARRQIPYNFFRLNEIKYNTRLTYLNEPVYVIPTYNKEGSINNLYKVCARQDDPSRLVIMATPSLEATLFNLPQKIEQEVWLCEGHWDKLAAEAICGPVRNVTCIGYPGSTFKQTWTSHFAFKDIIIFPDNDKAGEKSLEQILGRFEKSVQRPKSIRYLHWPTPTPNKYDLNDLYKDLKEDSYKFIQDHLVEASISSLTKQISNLSINSDKSCDTFDKLTESCISAYHFTPDMELLLITLLTSIYALKIEGEQLWFRIIGAPGSTKTTCAKIVGSSDQTVMLDTFTGLLSGWKDDEETDASLIPRIAGKALIIKDADSLLQQPNIQQIMSEFRAFYDKSIATQYRNKQAYDYKNIRSAILLNGTHALRGIDNTALGERFLDYEIYVSDEDRNAISNKIMRRSIQEAISGHSPETDVLIKAKGFIDNHLWTRDSVASLSSKDEERIIAFSNLITYMRGRVLRDHKGEIKYKAFPEVPSRITAQLSKLYLTAPRVLGALDVPKIITILVHRITRDIMNKDSNRYKITHLLCIEPFLTSTQIEEITQLPKHIVEREVADMHELGMLRLGSVRTSTQYILRTFALKEDLETQWKLLQSQP